MRVAGNDERNAEDQDRDRTQERAGREIELERLAVLASTGHHAAMERLLAQVRPPVVRYCRARLGRSTVGLQTPEDVAQDVLFALCGALTRFRPGETRLMAFVYGIASKKVADAYRAEARDRSDPTDGLPDAADPAPGPEHTAVHHSEVDDMRGLLDMLPEHQREVLVLRVALRFSAAETAVTMGSTPGAIRVMQHRAMARLRTMVAERSLAGEG